MIPISTARLGPEVEAEVLAVLRSGMIAQGPRVARLEAEFAELVGVRHVVAVNSGTTALVATLQALGRRRGRSPDGGLGEVVTSPFTFAATLNAILEAGGTARFGDISEDDFCLTPASAAAVASERTDVVLPVHLYGQGADVAAFAALAREHGAALVEDAAQAHGARVDGRAVGSVGTGCFSLYATKNLTSGEGGLITTDDDALADDLRVLRNQGMRARYEYVAAGHNYRMTDLAAAVVLPQLAGYAAQVERRRANAARLTAGLADVTHLRLPAVRPGREHVWHQYTVLVEPGSPVDRDTLAARLTEAGVGTGVYYPRLVFDHDCYRDHPRVVPADAPVARSVAARALSLPVHPHLSDDDVDRVVGAVADAVGGAA